MYWYRVEFINEEYYSQTTSEGLIGATSYGAAAEEIVKYVGKDNIISLYLTEMSNPLEIDELQDVINDYEKEEN